MNIKTAGHKHSKLVLIGCLLLTLVSASIILFGQSSRHDISKEYVDRLNSNFSAEFNDLNSTLASNGFTLGELKVASCTVGSQNSGVGGLLLCSISNDGSLTATEAQISNWPVASQQIDTYFKNHSWKSRDGYRSDVTYSSIQSMFEASAKGPVVVMYEKRFPNITCRFVLDVNREYPHQKNNQVDLSEYCEKDI